MRRTTVLYKFAKIKPIGSIQNLQKTKPMDSILEFELAKERHNLEGIEISIPCEDRDAGVSVVKVFNYLYGLKAVVHTIALAGAFEATRTVMVEPRW